MQGLRLLALISFNNLIKLRPDHSQDGGCGVPL